VTEVLLEPVVEFLITKAGEGGGAGEADLVRMVETGRQEEVAGTLAERFQDRGRSSG
jgi:hypothetical protein